MKVQTWILIFAATTLASGCRFGNYAEDPKPRESYQSVDLFFTQAKSLGTVAVLDNNQATENLNAPLAAIPGSVRNTFSNPVYLAIPVNPQSAPIFVDITQNYYLSTTLDAQGNVDDYYLSPVSVLWNNPNCLTQVEISQKGSFDRSQTGSVSFPDTSTAPVQGRLELTFSYLRVIQGDCQDDLQRLADCYSNGSGCSTDELSAATTLYDLSIRTNVLNINDAARVRGLAYEVKFE